MSHQGPSIVRLAGAPTGTRLRGSGAGTVLTQAVRVYQFRHIRADRQSSHTGYASPMAVWRAVKRFFRELIMYRTSMRD